MATKKAASTEVVSLIPDTETTARPRLTKLIIKNFRTIGSNPVEIDLDDIVVLVGANNTGKSSILRAYEVAMNTGSKAGQLAIDDFPNGIVSPDALPEVEVHTIISENKPGQQWVSDVGNGEMLIRERWTWSSPNAVPKRQGFNVQENDWSDSVPWGAPNVANAYRPKPHSIDAFASSERQEKEISDLITGIINDKLKKIKSADNTTDKTDYDLLIERIVAFQSTVALATKEEVESIEQSISEYLAQVFHNYVVKLDIRPEENVEKTYSPFKESPIMTMGPVDGYLSTISAQGSGARRTLLWTALKYISENGKETGERPHVLLIDEPEICLHPSAIRDARKVLYNLPKLNNWQVMVTTHSPVFIDLSYDNTTIVRVDRNNDNAIKSTTLYRPKTANLSDDDKENLKLLNVCDPYVHEFFFGGKIVVVEGDTEYTAFSWLKNEYSDLYSDVHIIRARGKAIIPSVVKILNQFTCDYAVLHDTDSPQTADGRTNPAWTVNKNILDAITNNSMSAQIRLIACKTTFESAIFNESVSKDKPYNAIVRIKKNENEQSKVKQLLDSLLMAEKEPPCNCIRWNDIKQLEADEVITNG
jgi:putative ATP-dependent endonuclease of OLD family